MGYNRRRVLLFAKIKLKQSLLSIINNKLIDLNRALNQKRSIIENARKKRKVILLHDNAQSHISKVVKDMLSTL